MKEAICARPEALLCGTELTLCISIAGLSLLPLGYDRKRGYRNCFITQGAGCRTYLGRRKKNFQTKWLCPRLLGVFIQSWAADARNSSIVAVLFLFPRDQIETASGEWDGPMGHVETVRNEPGVRLSGVDFELRSKGFDMCSRMRTGYAVARLTAFFFWTHSLVNQGWGGFYIDRARVLELRLLASHVAPRWRWGPWRNGIAFNGRTEN